MNTPHEIRVLLVDDHTLFRKGLAELLEKRGEITIAGIAGNGDEALQLLETSQPDVVITDLNMPPHGGLALLRQIRTRGWTVPVLVLTVSDAEDDLANAMSAGARGYLLKDMEPDDVVDAVQRAVRGEAVVAPAMTMKLVNLLQGGNQGESTSGSAETSTSGVSGDSVRKPGMPGMKADALQQLTSREREILNYLAQGLQNKVIARTIDISIDTVKMHVRHILAKLNLTSRVEAAVFAVEQKASQQSNPGGHRQ